MFYSRVLFLFPSTQVLLFGGDIVEFLLINLLLYVMQVVEHGVGL